MHRHRGPPITNGHVDVATPEQLLFKLPQQRCPHPRISTNITHRLMKCLWDHRQPPTRVQHAPRPLLNQECIVRSTAERITWSSNSAQRKHPTRTHPPRQIEHALNTRQVEVPQRQRAPPSRHSVHKFPFEQIRRQRVLHERNPSDGSHEPIANLHPQEPVERQVGNPNPKRHRLRKPLHRCISPSPTQGTPGSQLASNEPHAVPISRQRAVQIKPPGARDNTGYDRQFPIPSPIHPVPGPDRPVVVHQRSGNLRPSHSVPPSIPIQQLTNAQLPNPRPHLPPSSTRHPPRTLIKPLQRPNQVTVSPPRCPTSNNLGDFGNLLNRTQQHIDANPEDPFQQPSSRRPYRTQRLPGWLPPRRQPLKMPHSNASRLPMLTSKHLRELGKLLVRLPPLPDPLLKHGTKSPPSPLLRLRLTLPHVPLPIQADQALIVT